MSTRVLGAFAPSRATAPPRAPRRNSPRRGSLAPSRPRRGRTSATASSSLGKKVGGDDDDASAIDADPPGSPRVSSRRAALIGASTALASLTALEAAPGAARADPVRLFPSDLDPSRRFFHSFPPVWEPYFGWGERRTVRRELVPGQIWSLEQEQALDVLAMNIRTTVVRLERTGGLVVFSPQAPTREFFRLLDELGEVEHVVLPTYALEHKVYLPALARRYPAAKTWVVDGTWSVPIDLPLRWLGIDAQPWTLRESFSSDFATRVGGGETFSDEPPSPPPWADELPYKVLRVDTAGANPYVEAVFLHEASRTLLVTDLALSIPREPPEVISRERLLNLAPDDPKDAPAADTPENLRTRWAKASLVVSFLGPARQAQVEEGAFKGKLRWEPGYERSFDAVADRVAPSPILRTLVFSKGRAATRRFLDELERDWGGGRREEGGAVDDAADEANEAPKSPGFDRIVPAHYDAPIEGNAATLRREAFAFLDEPDFLAGLRVRGAELPEEDMGVLLQVNDVLEKIGLGKGSE